MLLHKKRLLKKFAPVVDRATAGSGTVLEIRFPMFLLVIGNLWGNSVTPCFYSKFPRLEQLTRNKKTPGSVLRNPGAAQWGEFGLRGQALCKVFSLIRARTSGIVLAPTHNRNGCITIYCSVCFHKSYLRVV